MAGVNVNVNRWNAISPRTARGAVEAVGSGTATIPDSGQAAAWVAPVVPSAARCGPIGPPGIVTPPRPGGPPGGGIGRPGGPGGPGAHRPGGPGVPGLLPGGPGHRPGMPGAGISAGLDFPEVPGDDPGLAPGPGGRPGLRQAPAIAPECCQVRGRETGPGDRSRHSTRDAAAGPTATCPAATVRPQPVRPEITRPQPRPIVRPAPAPIARPAPAPIARPAPAPRPAIARPAPRPSPAGRGRGRSGRWRPASLRGRRCLTSNQRRDL